MRAHVMQTYSELMQMAPTEQKKAVEEFWQHFSKMRQERSFEKPWEERKKEREQSAEEPQRRMYFGVSDFWSTIDARNAAIAIEKGLSSDYEGSHPLFVCDANNSTGIASEVLAQRFYSQVQMRKKSMEDTQSLLSFARAQELIGYAPQY
jgi:ribosomal protein S21